MSASSRHRNLRRKRRSPSVLFRLRALFQGITWPSVVISVLSSAFLAFGLYNVHAVSQITEGGALGLVLLLDHWCHISPSVTQFVINVICYALGWKFLGRTFLIYSAVSTAGFSLTYRICEMFDPLFPQIASYPLLASVVGAVFVGVGAGFCVLVGGAPTGDDALAMSLSKVSRMPIQWMYLISDLAVLLLSLSYIPLRRIAYSLLTVILSGQIIGWIVKIPLPFLSPGKAGQEKAPETGRKKVSSDSHEKAV